MSNLVEHAKRELALVGNDQDFDDSIINAVEAFASYGHSGSSASVGIHILNELLQFKSLTPLTENSDEWNIINETTWQSNRNPEAFSNDAGFTYYLISEGGSNDNPYPRYKTNKAF